jgi:hypothetical protein
MRTPPAIVIFRAVTATITILLLLLLTVAFVRAARQQSATVSVTSGTSPVTGRVHDGAGGTTR